jgi:pre-mRNA-processing factor 40
LKYVYVTDILLCCKLMNSQRALNQTKWKEYFSGGRKYYYNVSKFTYVSLLALFNACAIKTETKESKWDLPEELQQLMKTVEEDTKSTAAYVCQLITRSC